MKLERTVELPQKDDIEVSLKLGDEMLEFAIRPREAVDQEELGEISKRLDKEDAAPKRYAEVIELISVSKGLIESYERALVTEREKKAPSQKRIDELLQKRARELESLKSLLEEKHSLADTPYDPEPIHEEQARLFCARGFDALEKYAEAFSWRETVYLIGSLLKEAEEKK